MSEMFSLYLTDDSSKDLISWGPMFNDVTEVMFVDPNISLPLPLQLLL